MHRTWCVGHCCLDVSLLHERPGRRHRWESCLLWEILPGALNGKAALARRAEGSQFRASLPFGRRRSSVFKRARRPGRPVRTSAGARCLPRWRPRMNECGPAQSTFRPPGSGSLHPLFQAPLKQSKGMCVARLQRPGHSRRHQGVEEVQPSGRTDTGRVMCARKHPRSRCLSSSKALLRESGAVARASGR